MSQEILGVNIISVQAKMLNPGHLIEYMKKTTSVTYDYENVDPRKWYPMEMFTLLTDYIDKKHSSVVLRNIGTEIIPQLLDLGIFPKMSPKAFILGLSTSYRQANRGPRIGDWKVIKEEEEQGRCRITLENTTVHNCHLEEGVLLGGLRALNTHSPKVKPSACVQRGDQKCMIVVSWRK